MRLLVIIMTAVFAQGCLWGFPPPRRPQSVPAIVEGEDIEYLSGSYQDGVDADGPTYGHTTTAKYRGRDLTQNEFAMMLSPDYVEKARRYDRLRSACFRGNVFKFIATFTVIGGVVAWYSLDGRTDSTTRHLVGGGVVAGGLALGGLAYLIGGNKCSPATELGESIGASEFDNTQLFAAPAGQAEVDKFNETHGSKKPTPTDEPPAPTDDAPPTGDTPPADDAE